MKQTLLWSAALLFGLSGSALARPWDSNSNPTPPQGVVRGGDGSRDANDGRGDRDVDRAQKAARPAAQGTSMHGQAPAGVVQHDAQHNDVNDGRGDRDNDAVHAQADRTNAPSQQQSSAQRPNLMQRPPAIPIKSEIALRLNEGCGKDENSTPRTTPLGARRADNGDKDRHNSSQATNQRTHDSAVHAVGQNAPLSSEQRTQVCRRFGVCIAGPASGDDDDKTE